MLRAPMQITDNISIVQNNHKQKKMSKFNKANKQTHATNVTNQLTVSSGIVIHAAIPPAIPAEINVINDFCHCGVSL